MRIQVLILLWFITICSFSAASQQIGADSSALALGEDSRAYAVTVDTGHKTPLQLKERPRLAQLFATLKLTDDLYWPAARLYRDDPLLHYRFERSRREILLKFGEIKRLEGKDAIPDDFAHLIRTARLAAPLALVLEPDALASNAEFDKLMDKGRYVLRVTKRPKELEILGFAGLSKVQHHYQTTVRGYTRDLAFSELADQSLVYLLAPSLQVTAAGRALWNESLAQVRPGTVLYVPLDESALPWDFQGINQQIIEFLQHRVTE